MSFEKLNIGDKYSKKDLSLIFENPNIKLIREGIYNLSDSESFFFVDLEKKDKEKRFHFDDFFEEDFFVSSIVNAGSVFIGQFSPESAGDYISGTNHVLPTNGFAKQYSGVNLDSFYKKISFQKISKKGLMDLSENIKILAKAEKLDAHANAVSVRFKDEN